MTNNWSQMCYDADRLKSHIEYRDWQRAKCYATRIMDAYEKDQSDSYATHALHCVATAAELNEEADTLERCYALLGYEAVPDVDSIPQEVLLIIIERAVRYITRLRADPTSRLGKINYRVHNLVAT